MPGPPASPTAPRDALSTAALGTWSEEGAARLARSAGSPLAFATPPSSPWSCRLEGCSRGLRDTKYILLSDIGIENVYEKRGKYRHVTGSGKSVGVSDAARPVAGPREPQGS